MNEGAIDELRLVVRPIVLGAGKALFKDVDDRHPLQLLETKTFESGQVRLKYACL